MRVVKYGVIGCGSAWKFHSAGCRNNPKIRFTSVYDLNEKLAKRTAKKYKMAYYTSYDKLLQSDIDAVLIMVPHYLHEEYVIAAAETGKHVLCEKPMATTLEGCDQMITSTRKAGIKFMIAENHRFLPAHQYIVDFVQKEWIGKIFLVRSYEGVNEISGLSKSGFWKGDPIMAGGGSLMDMGAHKFATINWILKDKVESAMCWLTKQCTNLSEKAEDNAMVFLKYQNGVIAETVVSFTVVSPPTNRLEIYGTKGTILEDHSWENPVRIYSLHSNARENKAIWYKPKIEHSPFPKYYEISARIEDSHFTDCILGNKEPEFTPEQSRAAIETILMSYLSAKKGKTATYKELMEIYHTKGTKSIIEGLEKVVQNNYYCIE
ncbi:MAG: Gfo/Idh/MocA family protein [Candidatus Thorarchaeota archaeon]